MGKKTYEIDTDSLEDCMRLLKVAQSLIGQLKVNKYGTRQEQAIAIFDSCMAIYNADISSAYTGMQFDERPVYYVYTHCEPTHNAQVGKNGKTTFAATIGMKKLPFYVGKGTGNRAYELDRNETHRKIRQRLHNFNKEIEVEIIKDNLTELDALMLESKLIDIFGLVTSGGKLVNLDEGVNSKERRNLYKDELHKISSLYKNSV